MFMVLVAPELHRVPRRRPQYPAHQLPPPRARQRLSAKEARDVH